ncbi:MAG TPA: haloacid dehalogenase-like hydrolase [Bdellovibrionota bacterium]|nr:haloacid dehalogenase-like hydrolase [Bdellovibrionota bacterium]
MKRIHFLCMALIAVGQAAHADWAGENGARIQAFLKAGGHTPGPGGRPVAAFDWDNTVAKNDVGDATVYWLLEHDKVLKPVSWGATSSHLTPEAVASLDAACPGPAGKPLVTSQDNGCAAAILSIYEDQKTTGGAAAFKKDFHADWLEPAYGWMAALLAGYTPAQVRKFADEVIEAGQTAAVGAKKKIAGREVEGYLRVYPEMKALIAGLRAAHFDVWIVSASPQPLVEVFARRVGVPPAHVIGIRSTLDSNGKMTAKFQACGEAGEGNQDLITYRQGKRCWINQVIFGVMDPKKMMEQPSTTSLAAGDSDTDVFFVKDARDLRVVLNRNKAELMCNAYANTDGKWLVNPMFISAKSKKKEPYSCKAYGLPDQEDKVF